MYRLPGGKKLDMEDVSERQVSNTARLAISYWGVCRCRYYKQATACAIQSLTPQLWHRSVAAQIGVFRQCILCCIQCVEVTLALACVCITPCMCHMCVYVCPPGVVQQPPHAA